MAFSGAYTDVALDSTSPSAGLLHSTTANRGEPGAVLNRAGTFEVVAEDFEIATYHTGLIGTAVIDDHFWTNNTGRTMVVKAIDVVTDIIASDGSAVTLQVEKLTGTTAPGSGNNLLASTHDLKTTARTVTSPTLTSTSADLEVADGNRLGIDVTGTLTAVAGLVVSVYLIPGSLLTPNDS